MRARIPHLLTGALIIAQLMARWTLRLERLFLTCSSRIFASVFDIVRNAAAAEKIVMTVFEEAAQELQGYDMEAECQAIHRRALAYACADKRFIEHLRSRILSRLESKDRAYELADVVGYLSELVLRIEDPWLIRFPRQWLFTCARNMSSDLKSAGLSFDLEARTSEADQLPFYNDGDAEGGDSDSASQADWDKLVAVIDGNRDPKGRLREFFEKAYESGHSLDSVLDCITKLLERMRIAAPVLADVLTRLFLGESVSATSNALGVAGKTIENHRTAAYRDLERSCVGHRQSETANDLSQRDTSSTGED